MKKLICLLFCLVLAAALAGCGKEAAPAAQTADGPFMVGYGRSVITPEVGVHMAGNTTPNGKISTGVYDDLYATCIAFTDGAGNTMLLYHMDLQRADMYSVFARDKLSETYGIPVENIVISATHTHSGPQSNHFYNEEYSALVNYEQTVLMPGIMSAAEAAMADRKPARMYSASTNPTNLNFVRHYLLDNGTVAGDHFGDFSSGEIVAHMGEADNQLQLLCFKREGGKDVVLMNWQAHAHRSGINHTNFSADIVGSARSYIEAELDCHFAYFAGAAGNVNSSSRISHENITKDYIEQGRELGRYSVMALEGMTELALGRVQVVTETGRADETDMPVSAFSIGDAGFVVAPYEMFTENGQFIKRGSPFETTFVVTCANGKNGYFPAKASYAYTCYEYEANNIPEGNAEEMADLYVQMLEALHPTRTLEGQTAPALPTAESEALYWNLDRGTERTAEGGLYSLRLLQQGQVVTVQADEALAKRMDATDIMGLTLDGDQVRAVHSLLDMPGKRTSMGWYVVSAENNTLTLNSHEGEGGKALILPTTAELPIWSITKAAPMTRALQPGDKVTVVTDENGVAKELFAEEIAVDVTTLETTTQYCTHCGADTSFYIWNINDKLPSSGGHYVLSDHVELETATTLYAGNICLDLNGKTVTQKTFGARIFKTVSAVNFALMDTPGEGKLIAANSDAGGAVSGLIVYLDSPSAKFYMYGGTMDASSSTSELACCVYAKRGYMEMHGGTMLGGTTYGSGSTCIAVGELSEFVMYGGTMVGGHAKKTDFEVTSVKQGGAIMRVSGTATIYDGTFIGGYSDFNGGALYVKTGATLYLLGGTVSGGKCAYDGAGLYLESLSTLVLGSGVVITDNEGSNMYRHPNATIKIHDEGLGGTRIGITAEEGLFLSGTFTAADAAAFISDDPTMKVVVTAEGLALQKK